MLGWRICHKVYFTFNQTNSSNRSFQRYLSFATFLVHCFRETSSLNEQTGAAYHRSLRRWRLACSTPGFSMNIALWIKNIREHSNCISHSAWRVCKELNAQFTADMINVLFWHIMCQQFPLCSIWLSCMLVTITPRILKLEYEGCNKPIIRWKAYQYQMPIWVSRNLILLLPIWYHGFLGIVKWDCPQWNNQYTYVIWNSVRSITFYSSSF